MIAFVLSKASKIEAFLRTEWLHLYLRKSRHLPEPTQKGCSLRTLNIASFGPQIPLSLVVPCFKGRFAEPGTSGVRLGKFTNLHSSVWTSLPRLTDVLSSEERGDWGCIRRLCKLKTTTIKRRKADIEWRINLWDDMAVRRGFNTEWHRWQPNPQFCENLLMRTCMNLSDLLPCSTTVISTTRNCKDYRTFIRLSRNFLRNRVQSD